MAEYYELFGEIQDSGGYLRESPLRANVYQREVTGLTEASPMPRMQRIIHIAGEDWYELSHAMTSRVWSYMQDSEREYGHRYTYRRIWPILQVGDGLSIQHQSPPLIEVPPAVEVIQDDTTVDAMDGSAVLNLLRTDFAYRPIAEPGWRTEAWEVFQRTMDRAHGRAS